MNIPESSPIVARPITWARRLTHHDEEVLRLTIRNWADGYANSPYLEQEMREAEALVEPYNVAPLDQEALPQLIRNAGVLNEKVARTVAAMMTYSSLDLRRALRIVEIEDPEQNWINSQLHHIWEERYGRLTGIKMFFGPAYVQAVATLIAEAIDFHGKEVTRILVVGGGDGHFTRCVKPGVELFLRDKSNYTMLDVIESDLFPTISTAPAKVVRADVNHLTDIFPERRFDFVIGESMIQEAKENIEQWLDQITAMLNEKGSFIHIQDNTPIHFGTNDLLQKCQLAGTLFTRSDDKKDAEQRQEAHLRLLSQLHGWADKRQLYFAETPAKSTQYVDLDPERDKAYLEASGFSLEQLHKWNDMRFLMGKFQGFTVDDVPPGQRRLSYSGAATMITKYRFDEIQNKNRRVKSI